MSKRTIAVVGLGYVGLPLAVALARFYDVIGFDINTERIAELQAHTDRTYEVDSETLRASTLRVTDDVNALRNYDIYIITVPTPVTKDNQPDLDALRSACKAIGSIISKGAIVVFESTVYPGVTEDICGPLLEQASGLSAGTDFFLGYSPERINPGDKVHTVERITKVVSAQTPETLAVLKEIYGTINNGNIFCASSIKTAEAAKVIENAQRDINVAFINEITRIMHALGLSTYEVLEAARTKWNFLPFHPGLVGGHCIGVDPYYLAYCAELHGLPTDVILSGRSTNEAMGDFIASCIHTKLEEQKVQKGRLLILGLTFKENVPDTRNTKVSNVLHALQKAGHTVDMYDPYVSVEEAKSMGITALPHLPSERLYEAVICLVAHDAFRVLGEELVGLLKPQGLVADIRGIWKDTTFPEGVRYWQL